MVAKSRRGLSSLQHGEPLYPGDRYSSGYSSNPPISNVNNTGPNSFFPVENDSSMASLPRNRRLSGSQQQEVICLLGQILQSSDKFSYNIFQCKADQNIKINLLFCT